MAKNNVIEYDETDSGNADVSGIGLSDSTLIDQLDDIARAQMGALARFSGGDTIASAATTSISALAGQYVTVTGTTTITAFGTVREGIIKFLKFSGALTLTHNATSLILPGAANIVTAAGDTAIVVSVGSGNWQCLSYQRAVVSPGSSVLPGFIYGLLLSNNATDPTNDIDVAAGAAVDSTNTLMLTLAAGLTKRLDAAWAVGTGNGGRMSAAAIADTTYHVFLIRRPDTGVVDVGFDVSPTAPTLPTNYTQFRRIGSLRRLAGALVRFTQLGDRFYTAAPVRTITAANPGTAAIIRGLSYLPSGISVIAMLQAGGNNQSTSWFGLITALSTPDVAPSSTILNCGPAIPSGGTLNNSYVYLEVATDLSAQIRTRISSSGAADSLLIIELGWIDTRV